MTKWTNDQLKAINETGKNIIVSAGAGSGKTAVLTERVITRLKEGIKINKLLILTFTNAAAKEMKDRIRKKISKEKELLDNLNYLDEAYITTFDSYTLSLVKKYSYILNISSNLNIIESSIIRLKKKEIIDNIFDNYYEKNDLLFNQLIDDFAIKNDTQLKESILNLIDKIDLNSNKNDFLNNYFDNYLNESKIKEYIDKYMKLILDEIDGIEEDLYYLSESLYPDYYNEMVNALDKLIKSKNYNDIINNIPSSLPRRPKNSEDILIYKNNIDNRIKRIKELCRFNSIIDIKESLNISKNYIQVIINILKDYYYEINKYKQEMNLYEFNDIEIMAINLLKSNLEIREEIKSYFYEICVDEYQDTSLLQEEFINLIENNNVYMVGDIKQSIYGFRNAKPNIFKNKYDLYSKLNGGIKIDLLKNFRSRKEVINGINNIFSLIMDDYIGEANYIDSHQMEFGNTIYEEEKDNSNYNVEIYNYNNENKKYQNNEIEAFIIGKDIINKVNNNYKVLDKDNYKLRNVKYSDFCIIMDRGSSFPLIKKIFEYLKIPLTIFEDKKITNEYDVMIINNIITIILKIKDNNYDKEFKYAFTSVLRSFLIELSDNEIFEIIKNNTYEDNILFKKCKNISDNILLLNNYELINRIIYDFNFYDNIIKVGNVLDSIIRIDNLKDIAKNLCDMGYSIDDFKEYLDNMINSDNEITYKGSFDNRDSVKIMNIHKSKGLEFPICYYPGLYKEFNTMDIKERFIIDDTYGFITPYFDEGIGNTILKDLLINKYTINNISERIRLFYVALTRSKEKIILITNLKDDNTFIKSIVDNNIRIKYNSFISILNSIKGNISSYIKEIDINNLNITKDYLYNKKNNNIDNINNKEIINYKYINMDNEIVDSIHASNYIEKILTKEEQDTLDYGTYVHKVFEETDFLNIDSNNKFKDNINYLIKELNINKDSKIYKEHEFIFEDNNITYNGIIDLVIINNNDIKIIDYKLKDIDESKYINQLSIYYKYINSIFNNKNIEVYLYSIINNKLNKINNLNN